MNLLNSELIFLNVALETFSVEYDDIKNRYDGRIFSTIHGRKYKIEKSSAVKVHPFIINKKMLSGDILKIKVPIYFRHIVFKLVDNQIYQKKL